jgi:hypothetical protein
MGQIKYRFAVLPGDDESRTDQNLLRLLNEQTMFILQYDSLLFK